MKVEKVQSEVQYIIEFGDSQRPEKFRFTESEAKMLWRKLSNELFGEGTVVPPRSRKDMP